MPGKPPSFRTPKKELPLRHVGKNEEMKKVSGNKATLSTSVTVASESSQGSSPDEHGSAAATEQDANPGSSNTRAPIEVPTDMYYYGTSTSAFALPPTLPPLDSMPGRLVSPPLPSPIRGMAMIGMMSDEMLVSSSDHSPELLDAELPPDANYTPVTDVFGFDQPNQAPNLSGTVDPSLLAQDEDDVEEIVRSAFPHAEPEQWAVQVPEFYSSGLAANIIDPGPSFFSILREPPMLSDSPEMLTLRFDRETCGILSVKDGPTENPWRTMVWPLARDNSALYHAIASMTSFHISTEQPRLRLQGIEHMRASIKALASGIPDMKYDTAIAATLALAFAESWDTHTSTGINHIKGAKILVNQALNWHKHHPFSEERLANIRFLCNAWVYMDVIARLTSVDVDESNDFDVVYTTFSSSFDEGNYIDPLMGAASSLFPIIGRVANLVRRVRRSSSNSPAMISHAMELKRLLEDWVAPKIVEIPEDPTSKLQDSFQTAEAYRWATLLYLHQAVPELPSDSSAELSKRVMVYLATVPLSSRTVIVHIYPLLAAGCEAVDEEDRQWVCGRWISMSARMKIGIIDRCFDVTKEVWGRRDAYEMASRPRQQPLRRGLSFDDQLAESRGFDPDLSELFGERQRRSTFHMLKGSSTNRPRRNSRDPSTGKIDQEFTVRGRLHWLGVMKDWNWEGQFPSLIVLPLHTNSLTVLLG